MTEILTNLSNDLAEAVEKGGAGVVRMEARDRLPASGIIWPEHDLVVTAHHVVERDENIKVGLPGGESVEATLAGRDPATDLAVLRVPGIANNAGTPAGFADVDGLRVGHLVLALGRPGQNVRATMGIVGAVGDAWRTPAGGSLDRYLQTDTVMYPGFSGGPLVDVSGRIVGLNTSAILQGLSITVPWATLRRVVDALHTHGRVRRGYLGVGVQPNRLPKAVAQETGQEMGLLLTSVEPGSPAEKGGLFLGDTIIALAGQPVQQTDDLMAKLGGDAIGQTLLISVFRAGQIIDVPVVPGDQE
jgi:S1-C subfamily serine protease